MRRRKTKLVNTRHALLTMVVTCTALLTGCAATSSDAGNTEASGMSLPETSTSPIPHSHPGNSEADPSTSVQPSASAQMICDTETHDNITRALALSAPPHSVNSWIDHQYTCTYHLTDGAFVISVEESSDPTSARKYFDTFQEQLAPTQPIEGLANLGFPAYETADGVVVFLKDNMTLQVDARMLTDKIGPHGVTRTAFSFGIATAILGCWTGE